MKYKIVLLIFITSILAFILCSCYDESHFVKELDEQFGEGTYTIKEDAKDEGDSFIITLKDYPEYPFHVGSGKTWMPYEYSQFQRVFGKAIFDEYTRRGKNKQSLYELTHDGDFWFKLHRDMNGSEAENVYDEMKKILSVIRDKFPIYNTQDFIIGLQRWTNEDEPVGQSYMLAGCKSGSIYISQKENFLAYQKLMKEEAKLPQRKGLEITNNHSSSVSLGADTLRTLLLKGFHITDLKDYQSLLNTKIAPGEKGMRGWCNINNMIGYDTIPLGAYLDNDTMSKKNNYVYVETQNITSKPCALKDTVVTKVVYHFNDVEKATAGGSGYLYLDGTAGDITRGDAGFDLSSRWDLGEPKTDEEKEKGIRYKDVLVKIKIDELGNNSLIERLFGTPPTTEKMDITVTWDPQAD